LFDISYNFRYDTMADGVIHYPSFYDIIYGNNSGSKIITDNKYDESIYKDDDISDEEKDKEELYRIINNAKK
jgi:hypothetical protein